MKKWLLISLLLVGCGQANEEKHIKELTALKKRAVAVKYILPPEAYNFQQLSKEWYTFSVKLDKERKFLMRFWYGSNGEIGCSFVELQ